MTSMERHFLKTASVKELIDEYGQRCHHRAIAPPVVAKDDKARANRIKRELLNRFSLIVETAENIVEEPTK